MKNLLCQPGRGGQWRSWLKDRGINRSTADRLVARHGETLGIHEEDAPCQAISNPQDDTAEKLARVVWSRFSKVLTSEESVIQFIGSIATASGIRHEWREEGLLIFKPAPKTPVESPESAPAIDQAAQLSEEVTAIAEEPIQETTAAPTELGLAVAAVETSSGNVV
jgi:hypothetical protein